MRRTLPTSIDGTRRGCSPRAGRIFPRDAEIPRRRKKSLVHCRGRPQWRWRAGLGRGYHRFQRRLGSDQRHAVAYSSWALKIYSPPVRLRVSFARSWGLARESRMLARFLAATIPLAAVTAGTAGCKPTLNYSAAPDGGGGNIGIDAGVSVLEHHNHPSRDGVYVDAAFTKTAAGGLNLDSAFNATIQGPTYAQPLYLDNGPGRQDLIFAATDQNIVYA